MIRTMNSQTGFRFWPTLFGFTLRFLRNLFIEICLSVPSNCISLSLILSSLVTSVNNFEQEVECYTKLKTMLFVTKFLNIQELYYTFFWIKINYQNISNCFKIKF